VGTSRSLEKHAIHSIVGAETIILVLEGAMHDGGVQTGVVSQKLAVGFDSWKEWIGLRIYCSSVWPVWVLLRQCR
jgi:hypothetical protein